jgi:hypothetical protein
MRTLSIQERAAVAGGLIGAPPVGTGGGGLLSSGSGSGSGSTVTLSTVTVYGNASGGGGDGGFSFMNQLGLLGGLASTAIAAATSPLSAVLGSAIAVAHDAGRFNSIAGSGREGTQGGVWPGVSGMP